MEGVEGVEETSQRRLGGWAGRTATMLAFALAAYALYWVVGIIAPQIYRPTFLLIALVITFLTYPGRPGQHRVTIVDLLLIVASIASLVWPTVPRLR